MSLETRPEVIRVLQRSEGETERDENLNRQEQISEISFLNISVFV